jgi:cytochrome c556
MTKTTKLGEKLAADLRAVIASLSALADSIESSTPAEPAAAEPETQAAEKVQTVSAQSKAAPKQKAITLEQVRAALAEKSRDGHTAEVRELLLKHGAGKLSEIDPAEYAALLSEAEVLGNG